MNPAEAEEFSGRASAESPQKKTLLVTTPRHFFLFITEEGDSETCLLLGACVNQMKPHLACTSTLRRQGRHKLRGRYLSLDPVRQEVSSCSRPQPHPFTSLWDSLSGAGLPNQLFSLSFPFSCGLGTMCQASLLCSLPICSY